jgi:hypothetical protein
VSRRLRGILVDEFSHPAGRTATLGAPPATPVAGSSPTPVAGLSPAAVASLRAKSGRMAVPVGFGAWPVFAVARQSSTLDARFMLG